MGKEIKEIDETGGSAFPYCIWYGDHHSGHSSGMSLRDWFAGMTLQGLATCTTHTDFSTPKEDQRPVTEQMAELSYQLADAMVKAREK